jgi:hypothetical protein
LNSPGDPVELAGIENATIEVEIQPFDLRCCRYFIVLIEALSQ